MFTLRSRVPHARTFTAALITAAASVVVAGAGGVAAATQGTPSSPKGDNGTVKVHRSTTPADDPRNEPKVCDFYLVGFHFDAGQQVSWQIVSWPPTGDRTEVLHGALTLGQDGHGRTGDLSLPDGHYKLNWNFTGENGKAKQKVFWVNCAGQPTTPASPTPMPTDTQSPGMPQAPAPTPVTGDLPVTG
jgi:hypothetical protein